MRKFLAPALLAVLALVVYASVRAEPFYLDHLARKVPDRSLEALQALLEPSMTFLPPPGAGEGPYPAVLQFHGCGGFRPDFMNHWADAAHEAGYMAVFVNSTGPRGISNDEALETVCNGKALLGQERAGDVAAALRIVGARPDVQPNRLVVSGWSHGAWTIMDLFAMNLKKRRPAGLTDAVIDAPVPSGAILFYPYCGRGSWTRLNRWTIRPKTITFIAGEDSIVDGSECRRVFEGLRAAGEDIEIIFYPDADHVFDDPTLTGEDRERYFDEAAAADAFRRYVEFLKTLPAAVVEE